MANNFFIPQYLQECHTLAVPYHKKKMICRISYNDAKQYLNVMETIVEVSNSILREQFHALIRNCGNSALFSIVKYIKQSTLISSHVYRYQAVLLRARFDEHAKEPDMRRAVQLLKEGEEELFSKQHPIPRACKFGFFLAKSL